MPKEPTRNSLDIRPACASLSSPLSERTETTLLSSDEMDVESLVNSARSRGRCLNVCLVASVISLFLAIAAVAVIGTVAILELQKSLTLRSSVDVSSVHGAVAGIRGDTQSAVYKMQNFAYLQANASPLKNGKLSFSPMNYGSGNSLGSLFNYIESQHIVQPTRSGSYFLYLDLNITCLARCKPGHLTVTVSDKLTCRVELQEWAESTPVTRKCWAVSRIEAGERLQALMAVSENGLENWKLENSSELGLFLVD